MKNISFILISLAILTGCSIFSNIKKISSKGNVKLSLNPKFSNSTFIGISPITNSEAESLDKAYESAISQIIKHLGVNANVSSSIEQTSIIKENKEKFSQIKKTSIEYEYNSLIKIKYSDIYTEIYKKRDKLYYKTWLKFNFDENEYKKFWNNYLKIQNKTLKKISEKLADDNNFFNILIILEQLNYLNRHFPDNVWHWNLDEYDKYETYNYFIKNYLKKELKNIEIFFLEIKNKKTRLLVTYNKKGISNFPILIKNKQNKNIALETNNFGAIEIDELFYEMDKISFTVGTIESQHLPFWKKEYIRPNPLAANNYKILIKEKSMIDYPIIKNKIKNHLKKYNYQFTENLNDSLIYIEINAKQTETKKNDHLYSVKINLEFKVFNSKNYKKLFSYNIPNDRFKNLYGYGKSLEEAKFKALSLDNLENKNEFINFISKKINNCAKIVINKK